jgi:hypothetical protein
MNLLLQLSDNFFMLFSCVSSSMKQNFTNKQTHKLTHKHLAPHMDLFGSLWLPMTSYGSIWLPMAPYGSLWFPMPSYVFYAPICLSATPYVFL